MGEKEHKIPGFSLPFPKYNFNILHLPEFQILTCFTHLSLRFLHDTSVKMFFLINNTQETGHYQQFYEGLGA